MGKANSLHRWGWQDVLSWGMLFVSLLGLIYVFTGH
jgi:hypothetical protein